MAKVAEAFKSQEGIALLLLVLVSPFLVLNVYGISKAHQLKREVMPEEYLPSWADFIPAMEFAGALITLRAVIGPLVLKKVSCLAVRQKNCADLIELAMRRVRRTHFLLRPTLRRTNFKDICFS